MVVRISSLVLLLLTAPRAQESAPSKPDCAALEREFEAARESWNKSYAAASKAKDKEALDKLRKERPETAMLARFQAAATANAGLGDAVPFLVWIVSHADPKAARGAMTTLMDAHVADPGIRLAVARLGGLHGQIGLEQTRTWLDTVLDKNTDAAVQAQAHYTRAALYVGTRAAARSEELRMLAIKDLKLVQQRGDDSLRSLSKGLLHEAEHLEPGLQAPDIDGEDLDGVAFKLSDYRGKVVLLDFWGDW